MCFFGSRTSDRPIEMLGPQRTARLLADASKRIRARRADPGDRRPRALARAGRARGVEEVLPEASAEGRAAPFREPKKNA